MCAKDKTEPEIRPRISGAAAERIIEYAEQHNMTQAEATEEMILQAAGASGVGERVVAIDEKLDRVLEEMDAPGAGAPVEEETESGQKVAADGATLQKIDYNDLAWLHSEPISRGEADFADKSVVKMTPQCRIPVIRGILLDEFEESVSEEQLHRLIRDVYQCAPQTAEGYLQRGAHKSWYPHPACHLETPEMLESLKRELSSEIPEQKLEEKDGLGELLSEQLRDGGDLIPVWETSSEYFFDDAAEQRITAYTLKLLNRIANYLQGRSDSVKWQLMFTRVAAYAREQTDVPEHKISELEAELQEAGVVLPSEPWWK